MLALKFIKRWAKTFVLLCLILILPASSSLLDWEIQIIDSAGEVGWYTSIALDSSGFPHISYFDYTNKNLKYTKWTGSSWDIQIVDSEGDVGSYTSLKMDSSGFPHISYYDATNTGLKYARWTGSAWDIQTVDSTVFAGKYTSLALDSSNFPHISYYDENNSDLKYARWTGSAWDIQTVDSTGEVGVYTSLALDSSNFPHICYSDISNTSLKYTYWTGSAWNTQAIVSAPRIGAVISVESPHIRTSIALDSSGFPHISHYDSTNNDVKYSKWTGSAWVTQTVESEGDVGLYAFLSLDSSNTPHISFYDAENSHLKYARWNGSSWDKETVDSSNGVGSETSIALDGNGLAHISYYDWENDDLKYARWVGGSFWVPTIALNRTQMNFGSVIGGNSTGSQTLLISNIGTGTLNWSASANKDWLSINPASGTNSGVVTVSVNPSSLAAGTHGGTITISDSNASNSPQTVSVHVNRMDSSQTLPPFGSFDTPIDGSTVRSSIPVTGWVMDDIGVESVKIYRGPINEDFVNLVYIGDAVFVEGARADVEQAYPAYPYNYKAGWGYMMLTNFLPSGGNGTFSLHAYALDKEGKQTFLGTKTIICDNANAVKPFGAIDMPGQGGDTSGKFFNAGWALTPLPNKIPEDGSTINVWVDGQLLGHPAYNQFRADIAALFPGYANSEGAVGAFYLDTTAYANGVHTIAWSVRDDAGNTDGIGSRFFVITNTGGSATAQTKMHSPKRDGEAGFSFESILNLQVNFETVKYKRGYSEAAEARGVEPDEYGRAIIEIEEVERIEVYLGKEVNTGYRVVGDELRPLPIGSTLDIQKGVFLWQPGPGFIGEYDLVFIKVDEFGMLRKITVRIKIQPKFTGEKEEFRRTIKRIGY